MGKYVIDDIKEFFSGKKQETVEEQKPEQKKEEEPKKETKPSWL